MGTSGSTGGPGDRIPLLPAWALPDGDTGATEDQADGAAGDGTGYPQSGGETGNGTNGDSGGPNEIGDQNNTQTQAQTPPGTPLRSHWRSAKMALGSVVSNHSGRRGIKKAGRAYTRALGGSRSAARSAAGARAATSRLGQFLANVSTRGVPHTLHALGLGGYVGRDAQTVFAAIADALAPDGATREQVAAREAINETLASLFEEYVAPDGNVAALETMTPDAIRAAIEASVAASIFHRWLGDLELQLEEKAVSAAEAVALERDIEAYIRETVHLDLTGKDPLRMDWSGTEGRVLVDRIYEDAYSILEGH